MPSRHGFPFPNSWPTEQPLVQFQTPFGRVRLGQAAAGVCGGMVFAALDFYHHGVRVPQIATDELFRYFVRRLLASWNIPFGGARYFDWQRRTSLHRQTAREWEQIRPILDAGTPVPLGIMLVQSWDPRQVGRNHQVLATGYSLGDDDTVSITIYDPNYPNDDTLSLSFRPGDADRMRHAIEGRLIRGFFRTRYRIPRTVPDLGETGSG